MSNKLIPLVIKIISFRTIIIMFNMDDLPLGTR